MAGRLEDEKFVEKVKGEACGKYDLTDRPMVSSNVFVTY